MCVIEPCALCLSYGSDFNVYSVIVSRFFFVSQSQQHNEAQSQSDRRCYNNYC